MLLEYEEKLEFRFSYWLTYRTQYSANDMWFFIDINQWVIDNMGEIGKTWGWEKSFLEPGINLHSRLTKPEMWYSWRFKEKNDAMLFKLKWA
jgi:hypothetical protein